MRINALEIGLTGHCNLHCRHCSAISFKPTNNLPLSLWRTVIHEATSLGLKKLDLGGGEPLTSPDLLPIINSASKLGLGRIKLLTNGTLLIPALKDLIRAGLTEVAVSLESTDWRIQNKIRQTSVQQFTEIVTGIRLARRNGLPVKINTVATTINLDNLPALTELAVKLDCFEHRLCQLLPYGRATLWDKAVPTEDWLNYIHERTNWPRPIKLVVATNWLPEKMVGDNEVGCLLDKHANLSLTITPAGEVYPCPLWIWQKISLGNIQNCSLGKIIAESSVLIKKRKLLVCPLTNREGFRAVCPCRKIEPRQLNNPERRK